MSATVEGVRLLEWDSEFWGFPVADADPWPEIPLDPLGEAGFLQRLVPVDEVEQIAYGIRIGFQVADVRVTLDRNLARLIPTISPPDIRFYEENNLPDLVRIARESHRITRFYADPGFPNERCDDLYETWIRNSCDGWADRVLVAGYPAHGYVTVHLDGDTASIGLIAVDEHARGQGVGYRLVHGALRWAHTAGATRMTVVTQGRNVVAQRLFQRCGFRTCDTQLWLHRWA